MTTRLQWVEPSITQVQGTAVSSGSQISTLGGSLLPGKEPENLWRHPVLWVIPPSAPPKGRRILSTDGWINKVRCIHTTEYYSALKKKEILTLVTILRTGSEIMSHERTNAICFHWSEVPRVGKLTEMESGTVVTGGWREGKAGWELLFVTKFLFGMMEKFCKWMVVMGAQHRECT